MIVNGHPLVKERPTATRREPAPLPSSMPTQPMPPGTRQKLQELGPEKFCQWILEQKPLLLTDTTFRDAHQSLLATRLRTYDMLPIAEAYAAALPELFSIEMWGGATFDTAHAVPQGMPWQRLADLRERIPNILFQMLLRASNAVGLRELSGQRRQRVRQGERPRPASTCSAFSTRSTGCRTCRWRWMPSRSTARICEAAICYTGDILDPQRTKYDLKYYVEMAKELEKMGAHILAIKDMAGLCKPYAAELLVRTLKQEIGIPIHFHTHDTSGVQAAAVLKAAEAGLDIADAAMASMSGLTSQPNLNSLVEALRFTPRDTGLDHDACGWRLTIGKPCASSTRRSKPA